MPLVHAGAVFGLQVVLATSVAADPAPTPSTKSPPPGLGALPPANDTPSPPSASGAAPGSDLPPPASDAPPPPNSTVPGPDASAASAASAANAEPSPANGATLAQGAPPAVAAAKPAKPEPPRNNLRLQIRMGAPSDTRAMRHISDSSVGGTYFMNDKAYSLFANVEAVSLVLDKGYDHFESEINLGVNPFYARPWLAPVSFTARVTTDWTDERTLGFGPSVNLTNLPFMAPVKAAGFNFFFQYYPLKTDNHWGDQDFLFYWSIPLYARRLSLRGFARLFISYDAPQQAAISNDLIFEVIPGVDVYLRDAEMINEADIPRRTGVSLGLRWLQKF